MGRPRSRGAAGIRFVALLIVAALAGGCIDYGDVVRPLVLRNFTIGLSRTDPTATVEGKLRFRGGVELRSPDPDFGGLSGLLVSADGKSLVAISDQSHWITGTIEYQAGNLVRINGGTIAPMLDLENKPMADKQGDAEGLASADEGVMNDLFVSFEGNHRVWRYAFGKDGVRAKPVNLALPPEALRAPPNAGLEGITRIGDGELFAVTERFRNRAGNFRAWVLPFQPASCRPGSTSPACSDRAPSPRAIVPIPPYAMTDIRELPDGDLLTLERRYDPVEGVGVQLRRLPWKKEASSGPDHPLDGEVIARFDTTYEMDNMEGLSIRRDATGKTLVYMVSDDNFNRPLQRTLVMMFELMP